MNLIESAFKQEITDRLKEEILKSDEEFYEDSELDSSEFYENILSEPVGKICGVPKKKN